MINNLYNKIKIPLNIKDTDEIIWFGDLNFRVLTDSVEENYEILKKMTVKTS